MGALEWERKATLCDLRTINPLQLCIFVALLGPFQGEFSLQNDDDRGQSWTIVDKYLGKHTGAHIYSVNSPEKGSKSNCQILF